MKFTAIILLGLLSLTANAESYCKSKVLDNGVVLIEPIYSVFTDYSFKSQPESAKAEVWWKYEYERTNVCVDEYQSAHPEAKVVIPNILVPKLVAEVVGGYWKGKLTISPGSFGREGRTEIEVDPRKRTEIETLISRGRELVKMNGEVKYQYEEAQPDKEIECPGAGQTGIDKVKLAHREYKQNKPKSDFYESCVRIQAGNSKGFAGKNGFANRVKIIPGKVKIETEKKIWSDVITTYAFQFTY